MSEQEPDSYDDPTVYINSAGGTLDASNPDRFLLQSTSKQLLFGSASTVGYTSRTSETVEMRKELFSILGERKRRREDLKAREAREQAKIMRKWKEEENREKEQHLKAFFSRLSPPHKVQLDAATETERLRVHIESKLDKANAVARQLVEERAKKCRSNSPLLKKDECVRKKLARIDSVVARRSEEFQERTAKSEVKLSQVRDLFAKRIQLKRERREKQILKTRVQRALMSEYRPTCERKQREDQRWDFIQHSLEEQKGKSIKAGAESRPVLSLPPLIPDQVLLQNFSTEELKQVPSFGASGRLGTTPRITSRQRNIGTRSQSWGTQACPQSERNHRLSTPRKLPHPSQDLTRARTWARGGNRRRWTHRRGNMSRRCGVLRPCGVGRRTTTSTRCRKSPSGANLCFEGGRRRIV